jgi:hypothetical protein
MKRFKLTHVELLIIYVLLGIFIYSGSILIHRHYQIVKSAYDISRLNNSVNRSRERIETLKVQRARIVAPEFLEQVAGRGGYTQPRQEQIILLTHSEVSP